MKKYKCPCCGSLTLDDHNENSICNICGWEDDWWDSNNPDRPPMCNPLSLNEYRKKYESGWRPAWTKE